MVDWRPGLEGSTSDRRRRAVDEGLGLGERVDRERQAPKGVL